MNKALPLIKCTDKQRSFFKFLNSTDKHDQFQDDYALENKVDQCNFFFKVQKSKVHVRLGKHQI